MPQAPHVGRRILRFRVTSHVHGPLHDMIHRACLPSTSSPWCTRDPLHPILRHAAAVNTR